MVYPTLVLSSFLGKEFIYYCHPINLCPFCGKHHFKQKFRLMVLPWVKGYHQLFFFTLQNSKAVTLAWMVHNAMQQTGHVFKSLSDVRKAWMGQFLKWPIDSSKGQTGTVNAPGSPIRMLLIRTRFLSFRWLDFLIQEADTISGP